MRIKSLSIKGFKTFYEKSNISFDDNISAIVGPNGCGKTNLLDALRWVLGEQNPRLLRSDSMSQIISDGNDKLSKQGYAEVSLIVENLSSKDDIPNEIEIKRRLNRSGESLYFLNGESCRLKDITDVVMSIGAGSRSFTIIPQGQIESYITAKPEEKRQLIDEAAGLGKYKLKRHETERKIILTNDNLDRVNDIREEVRVQKDSLSDQADKASEYSELVDKYKSLEKLFYKKRYQDLSAKLNKEKEEKIAYSENLNKLKLEKLDIDELIEKTESEILNLKNSIDEINLNSLTSKEHLFGVQSEIKTKESENEIIKKELESSLELKSELNDEINLMMDKRSRLSNQIGKQNAKLDDIKGNKNNVVDSDESSEDKIKERLFNAVERYSAQKTSIKILEKELNSLKDKKLSFNELSNKAEKFIEKIKYDMDSLNEEISNLENIKNKCFANKESEISKLELIQKNLNHINQDYLEINSNIEATKSRVQVLENIESNYGWLPEGIREFVNKLKGTNIEGILSDYIKPKPGFEKAIEAALGEKLKWILIDQSENTLSAIDEFKKQFSGRGTFIPMDSTRYMGGSTSIHHRNIVDCLDCSNDSRPFLATIFGETYVVDDIKDALNARREYCNFNFVTKDGEFFDSNGSITVGSAPDNIIQIKEEIKKLNTDKQKLDGEIDKVMLRKKETEDEIFNINERVAAFDSEINSLNENYSNLSIQLRDLKNNLNNELESKRKLEGQMIDIEADISSKSDRVLDIQEEIEEILIEKRSFEERFNSVNFSESSNIQQLITDRRKEDEQRLLASTKDLSNQLDTLKLKISKSSSKKGMVSEKIISYEESYEQNLNEIESLENSQTKLQDQIEKMQESISDISIKNEKNKTILNQLKKDLIVKSSQIDDELKRNVDFEVRIQKVQFELDQLFENIDDKDYIEQLKILTDEEMFQIKSLGEEELTKSKFYKLQKKIDNFGPVNLLAPEEFKKLQERYDFINSQVEDLEISLDNLKKTISKIDEESQTAFLETFNLISSKYDEYVKRLFGGGEGKLMLTNPDSLKDSGIEVMLKIGLKKYRTLKSYSGGERALAGIALLLSAYYVRPAPFLLLDEVDAPLDDKNITKFGEMLEEISKLSQVAIITHNKRTMKFVNKLIGVTSRVEGISEVVPVELP